MRRARHIIFNVATVTSLLILAVAVSAIVGSDMPGDMPWRWGAFDGRKTFRRVTLARTQVEFERYEPTGSPLPTGRRWNVRFAGFLVDNTGFHSATLSAANAPVAYFAGWRVVLPLWAVVLVASPLPIRMILVSVRAWTNWRNIRRARLRGRCPTCGYDLRATPDKCPECGQVPSSR